MRYEYKKTLTLLAILLPLGLIYLFLVPSKGIIVLKDLSRDTCILLRKENGDTIWAKREARILKNTFQDTLRLDFGLLPPGKIGQHINLTGLSRNGEAYLLYYEAADVTPTDRFCLGLAGKGPVKGELIIEYYY